MKNEFANRQNMHLAVVALLADPDHFPAWKNVAPVVFTTRAATLVPLVNGLTDHIAAQQALITGFAADKEREEQELEEIAHETGEALGDWFDDQGRQADAAQVQFSLTSWEILRDVELIARARTVHQKLAAALETDAASLADYGLDAADATRLLKELTDYEEIVANPSAAISNRKALTAALRPRFREVSALLRKMDRLVLRFRKTEPGRHFAAAWKAARTIRDLGQSAPSSSAPPTTPTAG